MCRNIFSTFIVFAVLNIELHIKKLCNFLPTTPLTNCCISHYQIFFAFWPKYFGEKVDSFEYWHCEILCLLSLYFWSNRILVFIFIPLNTLSTIPFEILKWGEFWRPLPTNYFLVPLLQHFIWGGGLPKYFCRGPLPSLWSLME